MMTLKTKTIPWNELEEFNRISGLDIPRYPVNVARPGLLARDYMQFEDGIGVLQAYANPGRRGFYVGLSYPTGAEKDPILRRIAGKIRRATRDTTGRRIRTAKYKLSEHPINVAQGTPEDDKPDFQKPLQ